jgi:hypothetical protein
MAVSVTIAPVITVVETLADTFASSADNTVTYSMSNTSFVIDSGTTPPATKHATYEVTMTAGAATIDLRALVGAAGSAVDGNGLKVQAVKFINKTGNANAITIEEGASNGYALFGAGFTVTLPNAGSWIMAYLKDGSADISATDKTIDISGTDAQVLQVQFVLG